MPVSGVGHGGGDATAAIAAARQQELGIAVLVKTNETQKAQSEAALSLIESVAETTGGVVSQDKVDVIA